METLEAQKMVAQMPKTQQPSQTNPRPYEVQSNLEVLPSRYTSTRRERKGNVETLNRNETPISIFNLCSRHLDLLQRSTITPVSNQRT